MLDLSAMTSDNDLDPKQPKLNKCANKKTPRIKARLEAVFTVLICILIGCLATEVTEVMFAPFLESISKSTSQPTTSLFKILGLS